MLVYSHFYAKGFKNDYNLLTVIFRLSIYFLLLHEFKCIKHKIPIAQQNHEIQRIRRTQHVQYCHGPTLDVKTFLLIYILIINFMIILSLQKLHVYVISTLLVDT